MFKSAKFWIFVGLFVGGLLFVVSLVSCAATNSTTAEETATTVAGATTTTVAGAGGGGTTGAPSSTVKLCFIHHSVGEQWLNDPGWENAGGLGIALRDNNYFVSGTNYEWGPDRIGSTTDFGHWWSWFRGPSSATYMAAVYANNDQNSEFSRLATNPGGENEIVMFKSCFPNTNLRNPAAPIPAIGINPLQGQEAYSDDHTLANAKGIYMDLLNYFSTRQDKLFIAITSPPLIVNANAANARAFSNWLVNDWLASYPHKNVAVFDFYNIQTGASNRHSYYSGAVHHYTAAGSSNLANYPSGDDHPSSAGNQRATSEFVPLLNYYYHRWKGHVD